MVIVRIKLDYGANKECFDWNERKTIRYQAKKTESIPSYQTKETKNKREMKIS